MRRIWGQHIYGFYFHHVYRQVIQDAAEILMMQTSIEKVREHLMFALLQMVFDMVNAFCTISPLIFQG